MSHNFASSSLVQDIMDLCDAGSAIMAYFYFDFRDLNKQTCHDLLLSLVSQLSTRSSPCCDILHRVYEAHEDGTRQPSDDTLMGCLKAMLKLLAHGPIFIILDALDECPDSSGFPSPRHEVLQLVKELVDLRLQALHVCVTSRPEIDIRIVLEPLAYRSVSLHDESGQKADIADYIRSVVKSSPSVAMRRWRVDDKNLVLCQKSEHLFETSLQCVVTRLLSAIFVCLVRVVENVTARTRTSRKLKYKRTEEVVTGLLVEIPEIEVKVGHDG